MKKIELRQPIIAEIPMLPAVFYEYGGMKFKQNTKSHICDDNGKVLCGIKSHWMEAGEPIDKNGFVKGIKHIGIKIFDKEHYTCQRCLSKWMSLNGR